jgi:hypothetical protein
MCSADCDDLLTAAEEICGASGSSSLIRRTIQRSFRRLTELDGKLRDASRNDAGCDEEGTEGDLDELGV